MTIPLVWIADSLRFDGLRRAADEVCFQTLPRQPSKSRELPQHLSYYAIAGSEYRPIALQIVLCDTSCDTLRDATEPDPSKSVLHWMKAYHNYCIKTQDCIKNQFNLLTVVIPH
jgi:hypothetical protein